MPAPAKSSTELTWSYGVDPVWLFIGRDSSLHMHSLYTFILRGRYSREEIKN